MLKNTVEVTFNVKKRQYLEENSSMLRGWLDEWKKSVDMTAAQYLSGSKRSIRLRLINRDTVLAEQVLKSYDIYVNFSTICFI